MTLIPIMRAGRAKLARKVYELTPQEALELKHLRDAPCVAFEFWRKVAARLDVDPETILAHPCGDRSKFTALPFGHGKWWCWPSPLECKPPDVQVMPRWMKPAI